MTVSQRLPAAETALYPRLAWLRPRSTLRLSLHPPGADWELESGGPGEPQLETYGTTAWSPSGLTPQRVNSARSALNTFREELSEQLDEIGPQELADRLSDFSPHDDWSVPSDRPDNVHRLAWDDLAKNSQTLRTLASSGRALFDALFPTGNIIHELIDKLKPGDQLRIIWYPEAPYDTCGHIPWSLLYRGRANYGGPPVDQQQFLGMRLRIAHTAHGINSSRSIGPSDTTTRAHILYWGDAPEYLAGGAREHASALASWTPRPLLLPSGEHGRREEICQFLATPQPPPIKLVYLYCQCTQGTGAEPTLHFGNEVESQIQLAHLRGEPFDDQPLVFVNACQTASASPFYFNELEQVFFERQCRAYIGSECMIPIRFGGRFAEAFFHFLYMRPDGRPMFAGEAMTQARKFFWDEYCSLGGLFYSYINDDRICVATHEEIAALR
ncbi:CHAT domain-containing protein [Streptomyces sp. NPDC058301]|uniref:CHAT domain-containing protein n=1 Tax=Streptomyces sp. NPDC058301 TaxID=3346436 RepID=UPI0036EA673A